MLGPVVGVPNVMRATSLVLALVLLSAAPAAATRLEVHTDVTRATITAQGERYAESSPAPFVADLPAGRYVLRAWISGPDGDAVAGESVRVAAPR